MIATPAHRANRHSQNTMASRTMAISEGRGRPAASPSSSFAQDFNHEHSGAARPVSAKSTAARTSPRQDPPTPSCIYLG